MEPLPNHVVGNKWTILALMEASEKCVHPGSQKAVHGIIEPFSLSRYWTEILYHPYPSCTDGHGQQGLLHFTDWVDNYVENIPQPELDAQHSVFVWQQLCEWQMEEKDQFLFTKYDKVVELWSEIKELKAALKSPVIVPKNDNISSNSTWNTRDLCWHTFFCEWRRKLEAKDEI